MMSKFMAGNSRTGTNDEQSDEVYIYRALIKVLDCTTMRKFDMFDSSQGGEQGQLRCIVFGFDSFG